MEATSDSTLYYSDYLELNKILSSQKRKTQDKENESHDEMLFIIIHQAYELWFKQILFELKSIQTFFHQKYLSEKELFCAFNRLNRIISIQKLLNQQISILDTMSPSDFLDFRNDLIPASGFQSKQFSTSNIQ